MSNRFWNSLQDEEMQRQLLDMLEVRERIFIQLAADLRVQNLTEGAQRVLHAQIFQPIQENLSESTCAALKLCLREQRGAQLRETVDGVDYRLEVRAVGEGLLLHFISAQQQTEYAALSRLVTQRINTYISNILALTTQLGSGSADRDADIKARVHQNTLRILRTQMHAALLESLQREYEPEMQLYDAAELCRAMIRQLPETRVKVRLEAPERCPAVFDWALMQQAVSGLLTNAIQAAEREVTLSLSQTGRRVMFSVADDGCGLTAAQLERLCSGWRYLQEEDDWSELAAEHRAWGMGLPLAEYIAGLHGGVLLAHRNEPRGAHIVLSIPDDLDALHLMRQEGLRPESGLDPLQVEFSIL